MKRIYTFFVLDLFIFYGLYEIGLMKFILSSDKTYLSVAIMNLVFFFNILLWLWYSAWELDKVNIYYKWMDYVIDMLPALGLLGTVIGFIMLFMAVFAEPSQVNIDYVKNHMFPALTDGIGTALVTTMMGMIASLYCSFKRLVLLS